MWRQRDYIRNLRERFGLLPNEFNQTTHGSIWVHAVSVGEIVAAAGPPEVLLVDGNGEARPAGSGAFDHFG